MVKVGAIDKTDIYSKGVLEYLQPLGERQAHKYGVSRKRLDKIQYANSYEAGLRLPYPVSGVLNSQPKAFEKLLNNGHVPEFDIRSGLCLKGCNETSKDAEKRPTLENYFQLEYLRALSESFEGPVTILLPDAEYSTKRIKSIGVQPYSVEEVEAVSETYRRMIEKIVPNAYIVQTSYHTEQINNRVNELKNSGIYAKLKNVAKLYYNNSGKEALNAQRELVTHYGILHEAMRSFIVPDEKPRHTLFTLDTSEMAPAELARVIRINNVVDNFDNAYTWHNVTREQMDALANSSFYFVPHITMPGFAGEYSPYEETLENKLFLGESLDISESKLRNAIRTNIGRNAVLSTVALLPKTEAAKKLDVLYSKNEDAQYHDAIELIMNELEYAKRLVE